MWDTAVRDLRHVARGLVRNASFTVVAVATLAIGIGATTAVFSVVDGVLLKPLPYPEPDRLVAVWHDAPGAPGLTAVAGGLQMSPSMVVTYQEESRSFEQIGLWTVQLMNVTGFAEPEQVQAVGVTGQTLPAFGVAPLLGRWLGPDDESLRSALVAMLSYGYWQERFGGDPEIVGKQIRVDNYSAEIVGIMPRGFRFGDTAADLIIPFRFDRATLIPPPFCCNAVARLRDGVTLEQANADIERMLPIWIERFPFPGGDVGTAREVYLDTWRIEPALRWLKDDVIGGVRDVLWVVMAMIGIVLVIASANVANLLLVRGEGRALELDVRAALGAGAWRIARSLLMESALLALLGGLLGFVVASGALQALFVLAPQRLPRLDAIALDARSLGFGVLATLAAATVFSVAPILRAVRARLATRFGGSRGASAGRAQHRVQNALVVGQVALALVLLVSSGLMVRTFQALRAVEPGFTEPESVQTFRVAVPPPLVPDPQAVWRLQQNIVDALRAIPGVESAGFTNALPMEQVVTNWDGIWVEGVDDAEQSRALRVYNGISPGYLRTMGTSLVAGRDLTRDDLDGLRPVALVSEALARELWQTPEAAVGKRIRGVATGPWREVIGVVEDVRMNGPDEAPPATVYWPPIMSDFYQRQPFFAYRGGAFVVRSSLAGTPGLTRQVEQAVWSVNASLPVASMRTMQDIYDRSLGRTSFTLVTLVAAAGAALVLGVVGLYGVLSYAVSMRRREIAIRFALGARAGDIERRVVRQGVVLAGVGVAIGLVAATAVTRAMTSLLYDVQTVDPLTYAAVAVGLIAVAAIASYLPARRAATVDPAESLAAE
ncbi:MAG TPA: ABC transporter permease [Gammaproteobacteria bacterium]